MASIDDLDDLVGGVQSLGGSRRAPHLGHHKTHCKRGHEFSPDNTIWAPAPNGRKVRRCRACKSIRDANRRKVP